MHSNGKIKVLKIYNWEKIFNRSRKHQNCNYLSRSTAFWNKMPASNTAQSNTKDGFERSTAKTQTDSKALDCGMTLLLMLFWENKTRSYIHSSIQYHVVCSWNIIICPTSNVPANIYLLYIRLSVLRRLDVKCHISSCRLTRDFSFLFFLSA